MFVVDVLPLAKGVRAESLSYISSETVSAGTLVTAPLRNRQVNAIVIDATPAKELKAELKELDYELKQVTEIGKQIFFSEFIAACRSFAHESGVSTGATIKALTSTRIVRNNQDLPAVTTELDLDDVSAPKPKIIQASQDKQTGYINSLVGKRIKAGESVFICSPTAHRTTQIAASITTDTTVVQFNSNLNKTTLLSRWREAAAGGRPIVIVGTAQFLSVPRADLGLVIVAEEANDAYKMIARPHLDRARFGRHFAQTIKRSCVLTDRMLSIETLWQYREGKLESEFKPVFRYDSPPAGELVDMKELGETSTPGVQIFSPTAAGLIRQATKNNEKILLFVARRGRRPFSVCDDCGESLTCERCNYPLVLEGSGSNREFICRNCQNHYPSSKRCDNCGGWRISALGVGIDFVADILREKVPELNLVQVDGKTTKSEKQVTAAMEKFTTAESGALLTTELGVNRLDTTVDAAVVISIDSLLALPDLHIPEKLFGLLLAIREKTQRTFLIQTRSAETDIFENVLSGNTTSFYRNQIKKRERFSYPPFSVLIKLSTDGKKSTVKERMRHIREAFADEDISIYPAQNSRSFGAIALVSIPQDRWVEETIVEKLRNLPQSIDINVYPRSLL